MAKKIGIYSLSLGSGKTTTCAYLATALAATGQKVKAVDISGDLFQLMKLEHTDTWIREEDFKWKLAFSEITNLREVLNDAEFEIILVDIPVFEDKAVYDDVLGLLDEVILPIESEFYGLDNFDQQLEEISKHPELLINGILLTHCNGNGKWLDKIKQELQINFSDFLFETNISRSFYLSRKDFSITSLSGNVMHDGFIEYLKLANEIIEHEY